MVRLCEISYIRNFWIWHIENCQVCSNPKKRAITLSRYRKCLLMTLALAIVHPANVNKTVVSDLSSPTTLLLFHLPPHPSPTPYCLHLSLEYAVFCQHNPVCKDLTVDLLMVAAHYPQGRRTWMTRKTVLFFHPTILALPLCTIKIVCLHSPCHLSFLVSTLMGFERDWETQTCADTRGRIGPLRLPADPTSRCIIIVSRTVSKRTTGIETDIKTTWLLAAVHTRNKRPVMRGLLLIIPSTRRMTMPFLC